MSDVWQKHITDRSAWTPHDLASDGSWRYELSAAQVTTLVGSAEQALAAERSLSDIDTDNFDVTGLEDLLVSLSHELHAGRGIAVLSGVPVEALGGVASLPLIERLYWGLLSHLGTGVTQNSDASLIHYVTDGALRPNQGTRGVGFPRRSPLHVDLADCASLLCIQQAPDDPPSWLASSTTVHNVLLAEYPEVLETLYRGFEWDRLEEHGPAEHPTTGYRVPVFSHSDGLVSCRYNRYWMGMARKRAGLERDPVDGRALDLFDEVAHANRCELDFGAGDIQLINNYVALHGRAEHAVDPEASFNRLLMRIWFNAEPARPTSDPAVVRHGVIRHGNLGWTVDQLRHGIPDGGHGRQPDGRPTVLSGRIG